jgi:sporulation protein YlmC with PRC-barrel domain
VATAPHLIGNLNGAPVVDDCGRRLGEVTGTVLDCRAGTVTHLLVRMDDSTIYLPWRAVRVEDGDPLIVRHRPGTRAD